MYEKTPKSPQKMTNKNDVTHNTKHTILILTKQNLLRTLPVPPAHAPASVNYKNRNGVVKKKNKCKF